MRIFENAQFTFIQNRRIGYLISGILILGSLASLAFRGLELGIDFRGGMEFVVQSSGDLAVGQVAASLTDVLGSTPQVKTFEDDILISVASEQEISAVASTIITQIRQAFPDQTHEVIKTDVVGPRFADDLKRGAIQALLASLLVIFAYIFLRFDFQWRFSAGAVLALAHDVTITLGLFSLLHGLVPFSLEINQAIIAAFLTIVGYSLNDTVVVFDRIREYSNLFKTEAYDHMVNRSINNTLSRTIVTSGTTLLVVATLFIFGSGALRGFAFALLIGVIIGTYSSIFVASPVVVELRNRAANRKK